MISQQLVNLENYQSLTKIFSFQQEFRKKHYVCGSSRIYFPFWPCFFFWYILFYLLASHPALGMPINRKRKKRARMRQKNRPLHELPFTKIVKSGTIGRASLKRYFLSCCTVCRIALSTFSRYFTMHLYICDHRLADLDGDKLLSQEELTGAITRQTRQHIIVSIE